MIRTLTCIAMAIGALFAWPRQAEAAQSYDNCTGFIRSLPATITTQGTWCLDSDLATNITTGNAITIATNNVTLDCNHFKIGGLAAGPGTTAIGVLALSRLNTTVRNCNIRGFFRGISLVGGGHLIEDSSLDGITQFGIIVDGAGSTIRNNRVIDTGRSTANPGSTYGIFAANGVDVINNTVNGVAPVDTADGNAYGIFTSLNGEGSVSGNRIRGLAPAGTGAARGIWTNNSARTVVFENIVQGPGPGVAGGTGVRCTDNLAIARSNVIQGFETGVTGCLSSSNAVNPN